MPAFHKDQICKNGKKAMTHRHRGREKPKGAARPWLSEDENHPNRPEESKRKRHNQNAYAIEIEAVRRKGVTARKPGNRKEGNDFKVRTRRSCTTSLLPIREYCLGASKRRTKKRNWLRTCCHLQRLAGFESSANFVWRQICQELSRAFRDHFLVRVAPFVLILNTI